MKKIYTILCGLAISAVAHAQHYMWVVDEDNNRSKYDISTIDSITSSNTLFRIFFSDGTKKTIRYVDMDYISVKDLYREISRMNYATIISIQNPATGVGAEAKNPSILSFFGSLDSGPIPACHPVHIK